MISCIINNNLKYINKDSKLCYHKPWETQCLKNIIKKRNKIYKLHKKYI